jgi:cytochrome c oxidase assembly protein subunit 15
VICQAVLGGLTVLYLLPTPVSVAHACLAQTFFCLTVAIALFTSPAWQSSPEVPPDGDRIPLRTLALGTTIVVYVQLFLGAVVRHTEAGSAIPDFPLSFGRVLPPISSLTVDPTLPFPPSPETQAHRVLIHFVHRAWAVVVLGATAWTSVRALRRYPRVGSLRWPAAAVLVLVPLQVLLGASVVWTEMAAHVTTGHVVVGATILALSLLVLLNAWRLRVRAEALETSGTAAPDGGVAR